MPKGKFHLFIPILTHYFIHIGQNVPAPLATFQNNVTKIEKELYGNIGENNSKVFPKIDNKA